MADYWKSQDKKFCDYCKCWIADNKPSISFHEGGRRHKENVSKRLKDIFKKSAKEQKQNKKYEDDMKKMEMAANAAYLKDIQGTMRDMTADKIIEDKWKMPEEKKVHAPDPNQMPYAVPETHPRFSGTKNNYNQYDPPELDPCDPFYEQKLAAKLKREAAREAANKNKSENKEKNKSKGGKSKKKQKDEKPKPPGEKFWHEAKGPGGYSYYWNIYTNQSVWEPPAEGFLSLQEQAEQAQEQALQEQFLQEIEKKEAIDKADIIEEQRANAEREKLREIKRKFEEKKKAEKKESKTQSKSEENNENEDSDSDEEEEETKVPYLRDYSIPEKPQPYGSWQVVSTQVQAPVNYQLPETKPKPIAEPTIEFEEPIEKHEFVEKTCTVSRDSDDDSSTNVFIKRKFGSFNKRKNARQRLSEDD